MTQSSSTHQGLQLKSALAVVLIVLVILGGGYTLTTGTLAQVIPASFGGRNYWVDYCTCSYGIRVTIGPPRPAVLWFAPGMSRLYMYYTIYSPGPWTLGTYTSGGSCYQRVGKYCRPLPVQGTINIVGTSLI